MLNHPKASLNQLEMGDRAVDDLICLISSQLDIASQMRKDNHQKLVEKLKESSRPVLSVVESTPKEQNISMEILDFSTITEQDHTIQTLTNNTNTNDHNIWSDIFDSSDQRCDNDTSSLFCELPTDILIHIGTFLIAKDLLNIGICNATLLKLFFNQTSAKAGSLLMLRYSYHFDYEKNDLSNKLLLEEQIKEYRKDENTSYSQVQQFIWKPLVCLYFPRFTKAINITNWMHTLRRRIAHIRLHDSYSLPLRIPRNSDKTSIWTPPSLSVAHPLIENCEFIYKCPINFNDLPPTTQSINVRYCSACSQDVYIASTEEELLEHAQLGRCVGLRKFNALPMVTGGVMMITDNPFGGLYNLH